MKTPSLLGTSHAGRQPLDAAGEADKRLQAGRALKATLDQFCQAAATFIRLLNGKQAAETTQVKHLVSVQCVGECVYTAAV